MVDVDDQSVNSQTPKHDLANALATQSDAQSIEQAPLVEQLQSENSHLRKQVDHLTQVLAMQTQQQGDLVKRLEAPPRTPVAAWVRLKLQAFGLTRAGQS